MCIRFKIVGSTHRYKTILQLVAESLVLKAFLLFMGKKLSEKNNTTLCESSGLEPLTIQNISIIFENLLTLP